jgi:hypothetical protein
MRGKPVCAVSSKEWMEKSVIAGSGCTCAVAPPTRAVMDLTKCKQRKAEVDNEETTE